MGFHFVEPSLSGPRTYDCECIYDSQYNESRNESDFSLGITINRVNGYSGTGYWTGYYKIDGVHHNINLRQSLDGGNPSFTLVGQANSYTTGIKHDKYGLKSIRLEISISGPSGTSYANTHYFYSASVDLDSTKKVYPQVSECPNFTDETGPTVSYIVPRPNMVNSAEICISFDGQVDDIKYRPLNMSYRTYTFYFTEAEKQVIQQKMSHTKAMQAYVYIRSNLEGKVFYHSVKRTITIVNGEPTLSPTVIDVNTKTVNLTGNNNVLVRYYSTARININPQPKKFAVIVKTRATNGGQTLLQQQGDLYNAEGGDFNFTIEDSRGFITSKKLNKQTIPYVRLTCNAGAYATLEPNNDVKLNININGNYFNGSFGATSNTISVYYRYKQHGGNYTGWTWISPTVSNGQYSAKISIPNLVGGSAYVVQGYALDKLTGTVYSSETVVSAKPIFDWSDQDFNFNVPVKFQSSISGGDLDTMKTDITNLQTKSNEINDYVVAQGFNSDWHWRKWNSGTAECWRFYTQMQPLTFNVNLGGSLYGGSKYCGPKAYPFYFTELPFVFVSNTAEAVHYFAIPRTPEGTTSNTPGVQFISPKYNTTITPTTYFYVVGKWK